MIQLSFDQINAGFELAGAAFRGFDCVRLYQVKRFVGGSLFTAFFFFVWGVFNTVFYPSLGQWYSLVMAIVLTLTNGLWLGMALFYNYKHNRESKHVSNA